MTKVNAADNTIKLTTVGKTNTPAATDATTNNGSPIQKTDENSLVTFDSAETEENEEIKIRNAKLQSLRMEVEAKEKEMNSLRMQIGILKEVDEIMSVNAKIRSVSKEIDGIHEEIFETLFGLINERAKASNAAHSGTSGDYGTGTNLSDGSLGGNIISIAKKYIGYNETNGSYKKFTEGRAEAWCADFVTYVVKEAYAASGKKVPSGFGSPAVNTLKSWGQSTGRWIDKSNLSKVKPGDIMIQSGHTGIVISVNKDGTVTTIEGNTSNKVAVRTQPLSSIVGFVSIA